MGSLQGTRRAYSSWSPAPCVSCLKIWAVASSQEFQNRCRNYRPLRPGPIQSGMLDDYVSVAKGFMTPTSLHPVLDELTSETNGVVILYQEQTMNATRLLAGFTMAEADGVRSAIGKKNMEKMRSMGEKFVIQAQAGWIDVELENGAIQRIHRAEHFKCEDGTLRTV